jgi:hypothetical protein
MIKVLFLKIVTVVAIKITLRPNGFKHYIHWFGERCEGRQIYPLVIYTNYQVCGTPTTGGTSGIPTTGPIS